MTFCRNCSSSVLQIDASSGSHAWVPTALALGVATAGKQTILDISSWSGLSIEAERAGRPALSGLGASLDVNLSTNFMQGNGHGPKTLELTGGLAEEQKHWSLGTDRWCSAGSHLLHVSHWQSNERCQFKCGDGLVDLAGFGDQPNRCGKQARFTRTDRSLSQSFVVPLIVVEI